MTKGQIEHYLDNENRIGRWPKKQAEKLIILGYLASKFKANKVYHEREVNETLKEWHTFNDWAVLRRALVEFGYFDRNRDGTEYKLV